VIDVQLQVTHTTTSIGGLDPHVATLREFKMVVVANAERRGGGRGSRGRSVFPTPLPHIHTLLLSLFLSPLPIIDILEKLIKKPRVRDIYGPAPLVSLVRSTITKDDNFIQSDSFLSPPALVLESSEPQF